MRPTSVFPLVTVPRPLPFCLSHWHKRLALVVGTCRVQASGTIKLKHRCVDVLSLLSLNPALSQYSCARHLAMDTTPHNADATDSATITSLAINPASTLAVVGGASGGVRVISLSKGEVVGALAGHKEGESVEAVEFVELATVGPLSGSAAAASGGVVVTGATDGDRKSVV